MALKDKVSKCSKCKMAYFYPPDSKPERDTCGRCGAKLIHTPLYVEEYIIIENISEEQDFILSMIELKQKDIIEYQTKMIQFKEQAKRDGYFKSPNDNDLVCCPKCGSTSIQIVPRKWSLLAGFATKKIDSVCMNCKHRW